MQDMLEIAKYRGVEVQVVDLGDRNGDYADGLIRINSRRPEHVQRIILAHELGHEHHNHLPAGSRYAQRAQEAEADRHAAMLLVGRTTYQRAERMYGPAVGAVAAELGLPARFVEALREVERRDLWPPWCGLAPNQNMLRRPA